MHDMLSSGEAEVRELEELSRALEEAQRAIPTLRFMVAVAIAESRRRRALTPGVRGR